MFTDPLVSTVMAVYNGGSYLREAVESILSQTLSDLELIVVDDGSTDGSRDLLANIAATDKRLRLVLQENAGQCPSLIRACAMARGQYIARIDGDDVALVDRIERQVEYLERFPAVGLLGGAMVRMTHDGEEIDVYNYPTEDAVIQETLLDVNCFSHPGVMFRRDAYMRAGGYRCVFAPSEDYDLWLRIAEHYQVANLAEPVIRYRVHGDNLSIRGLRQQVIAALAAQAAARLRRRGLTDEFGQERLDEAGLMALGVPLDRLEATLIGAYLGWSGLMLRMGKRQVALALLKNAARSAENVGDRISVADARERQAAIHLQERKFVAALVAGVRALAADRSGAGPRAAKFVRNAVGCVARRFG